MVDAHDALSPCQGFVCRDELIMQRIYGKTVLHLGCIGFTDEEMSTRIESIKQSLHAKITPICNAVGVDYSQEMVDECEKRGLFNNIIIGDVEDLPALSLPQKFDIILAGDIIEHLSNAGRMLDGVRSLLHDNGELILTTPNAFGLPNYLRFIFDRFREGQEHVTAFNIQNIYNLLTRHGFRVKEWYGCYQSNAQRSGYLFNVGKAILSTMPRFGGTLFIIAARAK